MKREDILKGLTPNVIKLGWVSLLADISSEMLYPVIPIFMSTVLGAPVSSLGFIEGSAEALAGLLKTAAGRFADATGQRKSLVAGGYALSALAKPLIALASGWSLVLGARCLDRVGKGLRTSPRDALLADSVAPAYHGKAFGWHRGMDTIGAVLGPLLALLLLTLYKDHLRWIFVIAFIPGVLGALLVFSVTDPRSEVPQPRVPVPAVPFRQLSREFHKYLVAWGVFSITNSSDMFLILRAHESGLTTATVILIYSAYNLVYALASPVLGTWSDHFGRRTVLVAGLVIFALVYSGFAVATHPWQIAGLFLCYGLYTAATDGVGKALALDLVPTTVRASALGYLGTVTGLATLVASTAAGFLWSHFGSPATFAYGASGALVAAILFVQWRPPTSRPV